MTHACKYICIHQYGIQQHPWLKKAKLNWKHGYQDLQWWVARSSEVSPLSEVFTGCLYLADHWFY